MKGFIVKASVLLLVLFSSAYGQYEILSFDFTGGGARAEGMGNAYLAVSDNVNGLSWNPAGLYGIEKPVLGLSWSSLAPRGRARTLSSSHLWEIEHSGSMNEISDFSFAAPVRIKGHQFVGSFSYTRSFDAFEELESFFTGEVETDLGLAYVESLNRSRLSGGANTVSLGFGTRLYGNLSFGLSANIYSGSILREAQTYNYLPDVFIEEIRQSADVEQYTTFLDTNKISGMNFTVGFKHSGEKISTGLVIKTPFEFKTEYDLLIYNIVVINGLVEDNGTDTLYFMDNVTKYDMPWTVGLGMAYHVSEKLLVAADGELKAFKGGKIYTRDSVTINPGGDNIEYWTEFDPRWENVLAARLGGEYLWQTGIGTVPLRAGVSYTQHSIHSIKVDFAGLEEQSRVSSKGFSLGTGIHWEQIRFDLAYGYSTSLREYFYNYELSTRNHRMIVSFTGVF